MEPGASCLLPGCCVVMREADQESRTEAPSSGYKLRSCPQEKGIQHCQRSLGFYRVLLVGGGEEFSQAKGLQ